MKKSIHTLIFFLTIFSSCPIFAQNAQWKIVKPTNTGIPGEIVRLGKFDPNGNLWVAARWPFWEEGGVSKFDGVRWTAYSNVDSWMPSDIVNSIAFSENGVAWIGTDSGLIRFDGTNAQLFNMNNAPFPSNNISNISIDGIGNVWFISKSVTTIAHGVIKYDGTNWTVYDASNSGIPYFDITVLGVDLNNNVWVGTWAGGIVKFDGSQWTLYNSSNSNFNGGEVSGFAFTSNGDVWVTASGYGIYKFTGNSWQQISALPGSHGYSTVSVHPNGDLWFGTYGGLLVKYNGTSFIPYNYGNHLYSIDFDSQGNVWAGGLAAIKKYVNGVHTLTYNVYNTSLTSYFIDGLDFQQNGTAWFATSMGGICRYNGTLWSGFNPSNAGSEPWPFAHNSANDVYVDHQNGNVWVASNGVGYWNGSTWTVFTLANSNIPDNGVSALAKDNNNRIWIGTAGYGAAFFQAGVWTRLNFGSYTSNTINDIATASDGSIWFASDFGLHKSTDGINFTTYYSFNSPIPGDFVNSVAFEANGTMWVGTSAGLARVVGNTWTIFTESNSGLPANFVSDIEASLPGIIWVSAHQTQTFPYYGGIARFNGNIWTTYTTSNSPLTHYQVEKLKLDPAGNLWISTYSEGMMKFIQPAGGPLPVDLFSFTAVKLNGQVQLQWKTAREENSDKFIIERSFDANIFSSIGEVIAARISPTQTPYSFIDHSPVIGNNYYRLKMVDRDGNFSYSKVLRISIDPQPSIFTVYPNPGQDVIRLKIEGPVTAGILKVFDVSGKLIGLQEVQNGSALAWYNFRSGIYILELSVGGNVYREKFIKAD